MSKHPCETAAYKSATYHKLSRWIRDLDLN